MQPNTWPYPLSPLYSLPFRGQEAGSWRKTEWENIFTKVFSKSTITKGRLLEYNLSVVELDIKCIIKIEVILNNNAFKWYWSDIMNHVAIICDVSQHVQFSCPMYCTWLLFWKHHWQLSITHWHISESTLQQTVQYKIENHHTKVRNQDFFVKVWASSLVSQCQKCQVSSFCRARLCCRSSPCCPKVAYSDPTHLILPKASSTGP